MSDEWTTPALVPAGASQRSAAGSCLRHQPSLYHGSIYLNLRIWLIDELLMRLLLMRARHSRQVERSRRAANIAGWPRVNSAGRCRGDRIEAARFGRAMRAVFTTAQGRTDRGLVEEHRRFEVLERRPRHPSTVHPDRRLDDPNRPYERAIVKFATTERSWVLH